MKILILFFFIFPSVLLATTAHLFMLERSTNTNFINYDANITSNNKLDQTSPVIAYWIMNAVDGHREGLTNFENEKAYGFTTVRDGENSFKMNMKAIPKDNIYVLMVNGHPRAEIEIDGERKILKKIFIEVGGMIIPKVKFIQLYGEDYQGNSFSKKIRP